MDKHDTVIESIQKLISLGVTDDEIAENLYDVGIEKMEAYNLIREAKGGPPAPLEEKKVPAQQSSMAQKVAPAFEESKGMNEDIVEQIPIEKKVLSTDPLVVKSRVTSQNITEKIVEDVEGQETGEGLDDDSLDSISDLEKKIIPQQTTPSTQPSLVSQPQSKPIAPQPKTITPQQKPISPLTNSFDSVAQVKPFEFKMDSITQPQKAFTQNSTSKIVADSSPDFEELWKKGIVVAVNSKLLEMKQLKEDVDSEIAQKVDEAVRRELLQYKVLMESQKELIISSNKEALEQKQKEISFIIDAKIAELRQYNKQLSDNIGALDNAKRQQELALQQISTALEDAKKTKAQLVVEMNAELIKSKSQAQAFLDAASTHLNQMDERINKTLELEKNIAEGMLTQAEQKIEALTLQRADELISESQVELNKLRTAMKNVSPELIEQKIRTLDEFKKEFLASMQQNLVQINSAINSLNERNALAERELSEKTLIIDAKIEELTNFEKQFTEVLDKAVSKKK
jgi:hypothetical protein